MNNEGKRNIKKESAQSEFTISCACACLCWQQLLMAENGEIHKVHKHDRGKSAKLFGFDLRFHHASKFS